ncbi:hypothetical protein PIB30_061381 [Stylosanthes scabra]|uniref:Uncharacterized protein n=1 Tax=Stylosanthes scabra TaxID=79078 RepID=A0ABU6YK85_9FABA|nr:hypothetical protein [Stylosanthes scabra]
MVPVILIQSYLQRNIAFSEPASGPRVHATNNKAESEAVLEELRLSKEAGANKVKAVANELEDQRWTGGEELATLLVDENIGGGVVAGSRKRR